jgi:ABC-2 type transport system permease protein
MEARAAAASTRAPSEWRHFVYVTRALTATEFKLRYFGSVLGYVWTLLRPLMLFGVLYVVFTHVVRFGGDIPHYAVLLLAGIVVYNFFGEATGGGLGSLVAHENLLRKVAFPRAAVPISVSLTSATNLGLGIVVVLGFALIDGVAPSVGWLGFVATVLAVVVLAVALSMLLSVLFVRFRDLQPIWDVVLQLLFWGTPIIYTIDSPSIRDHLSPAVRELIMCNPLAVLIQQGRYWLIDDPSKVHSAGWAIGGTARLLIPLAIYVVAIGVSYWVFRRGEGRVAEEL